MVQDKSALFVALNIHALVDDGKAPKFALIEALKRSIGGSAYVLPPRGKRRRRYANEVVPNMASDPSLELALYQSGSNVVGARHDGVNVSEA